MSYHRAMGIYTIRTRMRLWLNLAWNRAVLVKPLNKKTAPFPLACKGTVLLNYDVNFGNQSP
ncbi:hypothetical protein [Paenibacillus xylanexedens]|uniref:hypothetical protein n=1 Tax=Paenibacillus xylanexedens TaxID=528191 RepID=UPI0011A30FD7|nr:hypothetical protein [Paenibacillus xylanexedens]